MAGYSLLLALGLGLSAPWWLWRMATSARYREGLAGRLGRVPRALRAAVAEAAHARHVLWVHAVSVGEVLAVERLVTDLRQALPGWVVAVSTTTATGQAVARKRLEGVPVFFFPLDFAYAVRKYLRVLRPSLVVLVESELWPRLVVECACARVPLAVVNARVSDRSFRRTTRVRGLWRPMAAKVTVFLAQGEESAERLRTLGIAAKRVQVLGNLKYDVGRTLRNDFAEKLKPLLAGKKVVVAGSTLAGEEKMLLEVWPRVLQAEPTTVLIMAPRHPQRFAEVAHLIAESGFAMIAADRLDREREQPVESGTVLLLNTLGDLASTYAVADVAFVGGTLVPEGGHNPLEAARFGVPVVIGESYYNFREIVAAMAGRDAISIISPSTLENVLVETLRRGRAMGERGRQFFEAQAGATGRTVAALLRLLPEAPH